jgi:hypothetical protein
VVVAITEDAAVAINEDAAAAIPVQGMEVVPKIKVLVMVSCVRLCALNVLTVMQHRDLVRKSSSSNWTAEPQR